MAEKMILRKKESGLSLLEVLISAMILALVVSAVAAVHVSIRSLSKELEYRFVAISLAKEVLEWGEAGNFSHQTRMKYYYSGATKCTLPYGPLEGGDNPGPCDNIDDSGRRGLNVTEGYGIKEWYIFNDTDPSPFTNLGDIGKKHLVPKRAPESVEIYYRVELVPGYPRKYYQETVEVSWQVDQGGRRHNQTLSVIPINGVNDQFRLETGKFSWD